MQRKWKCSVLKNVFCKQWKFENVNPFAEKIILEIVILQKEG